MKRVLIASLVATQLSSSPAVAATIEDYAPAAQTRGGAFAGARLRVTLGGRDAGEARAGLTLAPLSESRAENGAPALRFADGVELGVRSGEPLSLSIAGAPASRLVESPAGPTGRRLGVSTIGWIAIGVGAVAATFFGLAILCRDGEICGSE